MGVGLPAEMEAMQEEAGQGRAHKRFSTKQTGIAGIEAMTRIDIDLSGEEADPEQYKACVHTACCASLCKCEHQYWLLC